MRVDFLYSFMAVCGLIVVIQLSLQDKRESLTLL